MKKYTLTIFLLLTVLLAACKPDIAATPTAAPTERPTNTPVPEKSPSATTQPDAPGETAEPLEISHDWDDRSIFEAGLQPGAVSVLEEAPDASVYHITVDIPADLPAPITGTLAVRYTNRENVPLEEVYFRLFASVYTGQLTAENIQVDGTQAESELESNSTALRVDLPDALEVGESVVISMDFTLELPLSLEGSYGLLGYFNESLTLDTFYPMIPAYDEDYGWYSHTPYPNGDLTYQDMSYYIVTVRAPQDFVLAASGVEVERSVDDSLQQITYAAGPARDFYIAGSYSFNVLSQEVDGITVNSYAKPGQAIGQEIALNAASHTLALFNQLFGPYPYNEFDVVNAPMLAYGVEYPGITNIYDDLYRLAAEEDPTGRYLTTLETVIAHEVGHQWFYNVVGNDQQEHPWLDESVTQYITYLYVYNQHGAGTSQAANVENWGFRMSRIDYEKIAIGLPAGEYEGYEYSGIVYGRGPLFFLELEETYGQDVVIGAIQDYYQDHLWGIGNEVDLRASLEEACDCDLTDMYDEWIYN